MRENILRNENEEREKQMRKLVTMAPSGAEKIVAKISSNRNANHEESMSGLHVTTISRIQSLNQDLDLGAEKSHQDSAALISDDQNEVPKMQKLKAKYKAPSSVLDVVDPI